MLLFDALVEKKIAEAQARGEFDDLPGTGQPLTLDDDPLIPEDVRVAYRLLKNAGFVPLEIQDRCEIGALQKLLDSLPDGDNRTRALRKLHALSVKIAETRGRHTLRIETAYLEKILNRLS